MMFAGYTWLELVCERVSQLLYAWGVIYLVEHVGLVVVIACVGYGHTLPLDWIAISMAIALLIAFGFLALDLSLAVIGVRPRKMVPLVVPTYRENEEAD